VPYKGKSDKITFSNEDAFTDLLAVAPGAFFGSFQGGCDTLIKSRQEQLAAGF
jgi:hypothetical protein